MSIQYANKKIVEIQKAICLWEVKKIHAITSNKTKKIELEVECSENNKTFKDIKVNGEETGCQDFLKDLEIPKTCSFKVEKITSEKIKLSFDFSNFNGFDKVYLWELYAHKRREIIIRCFLTVFIITLFASLMNSPSILNHLPVKIEDKVCDSLQKKIINDTLIIRNELIVGVVKKKITIENNRNNQIILSDTSLANNNSQIKFSNSKVYIWDKTLKSTYKSLYTREIIVILDALSFLIINTLFSLIMIRILLNTLIKNVFGESSSKYLDPDIDLH